MSKWIQLPVYRSFVVGYWIDSKGKVHHYRYKEYKIIKETDKGTIIEFKDGKRILARI